jgi:hypothetical protein
MHTLEIIDTRVCVAYREPMQDKPILLVNYWPTTESKADIEQFWPKWIGHEVTTNHIDGGLFTIKMGEQPFSGWHTIQLVDGPKTKSIKTIEQEIPCPKVRKGIETRYRYGKWEKYLKTRGWVPA